MDNRKCLAHLKTVEWSCFLHRTFGPFHFFDPADFEHTKFVCSRITHICMLADFERVKFVCSRITQICMLADFKHAKFVRSRITQICMLTDFEHAEFVCSRILSVSNLCARGIYGRQICMLADFERANFLVSRICSICWINLRRLKNLFFKRHFSGLLIGSINQGQSKSCRVAFLDHLESFRISSASG